MKDVAAIVLAAGKGTRMRSRLPKVLHPLLGRPLLTYPLDACRAAGVGGIVVVVGSEGEEIRAVLGETGQRYALQPEPLGTAHAVGAAKEAVGEAYDTALILCGDTPLVRPETLSSLVAAHREAGALVTVLTITPADPTGYGRIVRGAEGRVSRIVEERDADEATRAVAEVNTGTYAVALPWLWEALSAITPENSQKEYYLTDIVARAAREGRAHALPLADAGEMTGVNSRVQLAEAATLLRARVNRRFMESGVTLEEPTSVWIDPNVLLAPDVTVGPCCRLAGETVVGAGSVIEQGCVLVDAKLAENVHVKPYSVIESAAIDEGAAIGPFAHLRPGAEIGRAAKVGNFVEIKKSRLGPGSKASHLTYLGDARVGEGVNIGAGTITCNYDGVNKHKTVIGARAFIGSNASLVAPVEVGEEAVVAAGSVITADVPPGALGVGRARQRSIPGWKKSGGSGKKEE